MDVPGSHFLGGSTNVDLARRTTLVRLRYAEPFELGSGQALQHSGHVQSIVAF